MELHKQIISWIDSYVRENKISTLVVGVSGGVDSALVSTLCAETAWNTIVVTMPIRQNEIESIKAFNHISWLKEKYSNVTHIEVPLDDTFIALEYILQEKINTEYTEIEGYPSVAFANARARLRMTTLYHVAAIHNGIVVGTGNKIEDFGIGFFTKYGDGGVDISPIADLLKSEVREMSKILGIKDELVNAVPTDGLYSGLYSHQSSGSGHTDEDQIGATYDELEWAMKYQVQDQKLNPASLSERQKQVLEIYTKRNKANQHKMIPIPVFKRQYA